MNLTYTVMDVIKTALSKIGVDADTTEAKNVIDAQRNLNIMLGQWAADPDLAVARIVPLTGYSNLTDIVDVPGEYIAAMTANLAVIMADDYDQKVSKLLVSQAEKSLTLLSIYNVRRINGSIPTNRR